MDIRQMQYLVALARERHFTRAAQSCQVTQPTLSERIRQLEQELDVAIVERGQRFHGFTAEGERVLKWAQVILDNWGALRQEIASFNDRGSALAGRLTIGVVPSALPAAASLVSAIREAHPNVDALVLSASSEDIIRQLEEFSIDAGITYLDNESIAGMIARPLYRERYALFVRLDHPLASRPTVTWAMAAHHPLALLTANMQNRRIIDRAFAGAGVRPHAHIESNSLINLFSSVRETGLAAILPEYMGKTLAMEGMKAIPLTEPLVEHTLGLVAIERQPMPPLVDLALDVAKASKDLRMPAKST
ncbi:Morphology and auto-aggregation control protein [Hartmannibacter diazotrophicus]|uniref:Morphology and auto-aggregation control protein n=1 Tax=Hartmannibacter diazotrophicus TaxID=1482074 RepID=A0A2C9D8F3_9HYPH|nr:LysR family transcriptional regulator [Hartmannibacter diazotrophicus]SON56587.1 Morphology and auto-aggregation control protein [Hartmannibacter diazotrophicus]